MDLVHRVQLIGNIDCEVVEVEDEKMTKVERSCGCDGTLFNETRMQANLEPPRERVSRSCGPQSAHEDNHSVEIHREGKENGRNQENPHLCMQILHAAMFQVFRGALAEGFQGDHET